MKSYAILVTGARDWSNREIIMQTLKRFATCDDVVFIHGNCVGLDQAAAQVAQELQFTIESYPAMWATYGRAAGPVRNKQMVDRLLEYQKLGRNIVAFAFHNNLQESKGTKQCVSLLQREGIDYTLVTESNVAQSST